MITVHPEPVSAHTHTHADTHTLRHTCRHSLPGLRSRGPDKTGDGGDSSEDSDAGALHLLTDSYAWRSLKAPPSHNLPVHGTHTHTQIDRHTHTHRCPHSYRHTQICAAHIHPAPPVSYLLTSHLFLSLASFPSCPLQFDPIHILLFVLLPHLLVPFLNPHPPPPTAECMNQHTHTHLHTHTPSPVRYHQRGGELKRRDSVLKESCAKEQRPRCAHLCCAGTQRAAAPHLCYGSGLFGERWRTSNRQSGGDTLRRGGNVAECVERKFL